MRKTHVPKASPTVLSAAALSLLPKLACPACWPAYAAALSAVGLGFLLQRVYLLPLTLLLLMGAMLTLARRGVWPFVLGGVSSLLIVLGKFLWNVELMVYLGVAGLIVANLLTHRNRPCCQGGCNNEEEDRNLQRGM